MTTIATAEPGVRLVRSNSGDRFHVLRNCTTPFIYCESCKAAEHGRDCHAIKTAIEERLNAPNPQEETMPEETTTAVAIAERRDTVVRQQSYAMAAKAALGGWADLKALAQDHIKSGFAPNDVKTPEQGAMILLKALELDVPITSAYEFVAVIHGRPKLMGQMVGALVARSGKGTIDIIESDNEHAVAEGRRGDRRVRISFSIADASRASLTSSTWKQYPADMLRWKAVTRVGRFMFADVLGGMDVAGAGGDILDSMDVTTPEGAPVETINIIEAEYRVVDTETGEIEPGPVAAEEGPETHRSSAAEQHDTPPTNGNGSNNEVLVLLGEYGLNLGDMARYMKRGITANDADAVITGFADAAHISVHEVVKAAALAKETTGGAK